MRFSKDEIIFGWFRLLLYTKVESQNFVNYLRLIVDTGLVYLD